MKVINLLLTAMAALSLAACGDKAEAPKNVDKPILKIGVSLPLTGNSQESGNIAKKSIEMFQEELKKSNLKNDYQFIIEDNAYDNKRIVSINHKFIYLDKVDAIVSYWNVPGIITADNLKDKKILHINFGSDPKTLLSEYDFLFYSSPSEQAKILLAEAQKRGIKKIAILGCNNNWSHTMQQAVYHEKDTFGIEVVDTQFVNIGERHFNMIFAKMQEKQPELYVLFLETPEFEIARKKMLEMNIKEPVTSCEVPDYTAEKELFEDSWYVTLPEGNDNFNTQFKTFSKMNNTYSASYIYDIMSLIIKAFEDTDTKENVHQVLQNIKTFNGKAGVAKLENHFFTIPAIIKQIKNGQSIIVEK